MAGLRKFDGGGPANLTNESRGFMCSFAREASGNLLFDGETILTGRPSHVGGRPIAVDRQNKSARQANPCRHEGCASITEKSAFFGAPRGVGSIQLPAGIQSELQSTEIAVFYNDGNANFTQQVTRPGLKIKLWAATVIRTF